MQIVETAYLAPAQCAFTHTTEGPFIDLQREFGYDHVGRIYIKVSFARELGVMAGLPSADELEGAREANEALREQLLEQEDELRELREFKAAATYTVEHMGERIRKKPGPKAASAA